MIKTFQGKRKNARTYIKYAIKILFSICTFRLLTKFKPSQLSILKNLAILTTVNLMFNLILKILWSLSKVNR